MSIVGSLFRVREAIRLNPHVARFIYITQSLKHSQFGPLGRLVREAAANNGSNGSGVALCCRIRDEAFYLQEFIEYYLTAGIGHIFFYEKESVDNFHSVLDPYVARGVVTLFENWPHIPVSPAAEHDCILRCAGKYEWVGFIDADEFVVIRDGKSIGEFLAEYKGFPAVALHWRQFGSNGHKKRPSTPVILAYDRREPYPNRHVKCFVRPETVAACRNSHSWYFRGFRFAVDEKRQPVLGSTSVPPTAEHAWINHYHAKSDEDYFAKAARKSVLDKVGIAYNNRTVERHSRYEDKANEVFDDSAVRYLAKRKSVSEASAPVQEATSAVLTSERASKTHPVTSER